MDIKTMSVNVPDKTIAINGEGHTCAPEYFPAVDSNIEFLHWHPERQGRCKGAIAYHVGGGHGLDDFKLLAPFVKAWEEAKERKSARTALEHAEAQGAFASEAPAAEPGNDPLPRFLTKDQPQASVSPEMESRLAAFEQSVADVLKQRSEPQTGNLEARIQALENAFAEFANLRRAE